MQISSLNLLELGREFTIFLSSRPIGPSVLPSNRKPAISRGKMYHLHTLRYFQDQTLNFGDMGNQRSWMIMVKNPLVFWVTHRTKDSNQWLKPLDDPSGSYPRLRLPQSRWTTPVWLFWTGVHGVHGRNPESMVDSLFFFIRSSSNLSPKYGNHLEIKVTWDFD